jgi:hypothetical protein
MINTCVVCGKKFEAQRSTKKYCSNDCMNAMRRLKWANRDKVEKKQQLMPEKECPICNKKFRPKSAAANQRTCCYDCMPDGVQLTRGAFLAKIKEQRGGKCIRCGYNKCVKALEFHHLDPAKKDFTISNDHFKLLDAVKESKKCILICSNCHKELHDGMWTIDELNLEEMEEVEPDEID